MHVINKIYTENMSVSENTKNSSNALNPHDISLLNWNIYKCRGNNWADDLHSFMYEQDIITIQEAHLSEKLKSILARHNMKWSLNAAFHFNNKPSGVMIASHVSSLDTHGLQHREPLIRIPKTILVNYYPIQKTSFRLLVANIHSINFSLGVYAYTKQIESLFKLIEKHSGPIIIAGDFNTWSATRLGIVQRHVQKAGLSSLDYSQHIRTHVFGNPLDHIFYRWLNPLKHHSWDVKSSDHNPTRVSFSLHIPSVK